MTKGKKYSAHGGFTLLEVLVAVAIFAIAGSAIVKAASEHINSVNLLKNITFATWVANNQLTVTILENKRRWPARNNLTGETEFANGTYYWRQVVSKTSDDELNQVSVTIYLDQERTNPVTTVSTFIAREVE